MTDEHLDHSDREHEAEGRDHEHEPNTFSVRTAAYALVGLAALCLFAFGFMFAIYRGLSKPVERRDTAEQQPEFIRASQQRVEPRLSLGGSAELNQLREAARETLDSYAWIDEAKGIARVPISRGMEMVLVEGFPTRTEPVGDSNEKETTIPQTDKIQTGN